MKIIGNADQFGNIRLPFAGTYFVQRYNSVFDFKVDQEIIPGEPGRTVVAVGAGGVAVGRIKGTRDRRLFRSYIFKRRDPQSISVLPPMEQQAEICEEQQGIPQESATMFCTQCGMQISAFARFCPGCGNDLTQQ